MKIVLKTEFVMIFYLRKKVKFKFQLQTLQSMLYIVRLFYCLLRKRLDVPFS